MFLKIVFLFVFLLSEIKCYEIDDSQWTDMNNKAIQISEYCKNKKCLMKCCPYGQIINTTLDKHGICMIPENKNVMNYSAVKNVVRGLNITNNTVNNFLFVRNQLFWDTKLDSHIMRTYNMTILENGSIQAYFFEEPLKNCVDFCDHNGVIWFAYKYIYVIPPDTIVKNIFTVTGFITSSVFMLLVLWVYSLLPKLCNAVGKVLMAYLVTLTCAFIMRSGQLVASLLRQLNIEGCRVTSIFVYYFNISSFFWLNVTSYDFWCAIRSPQKPRDVQNQGERIKFIWYGLYAWGIPAVLTTVATVVDVLKLLKKSGYGLPFDSCLSNTRESRVHLLMPIGIMTAANLILFSMTAYKIWKVKREIKKSRESNTTKSNEDGFGIYMRISILMGINWILEVIPAEDLAPYIIVNFLNVFIGIPFFIIFVCKKSVLEMLCKRFNIQRRFVEKLETSQNTKSTSTGRSSIKKKHASVQLIDIDH